MSKVTKFDAFLYEGLYFDIKDLFDELLISKMPLSAIKELKSTLIKKQQISEGLLNTFKSKFGQFLSNQAINYLMNKQNLREKTRIINIFDPTDFSDIKKCEKIHLSNGVNGVKEQLNECIFFNSSEVKSIIEKYNIFNNCDTNLIKWNEEKIDLIKSDFQLSVNRRQNIFVWIDNDKLTKKTYSWIAESVTKIVRGDEGMKLLIESIKKFNK